MHPSAIQPGAGKCPVCAMDLVQIPGVAEQSSAENLTTLAVPVTAVLDSGLRKLVYVERVAGEYVPVEVTLGSRAGEYFPVLKGLVGGERVVTRGAFLLDSQFQIQGLASLFYPTGQVVGGAEHQHIGSTSPKTLQPKIEHKH
jgi:Cu(I)/Ag(I) efflux system membrane fusion protein